MLVVNLSDVIEVLDPAAFLRRFDCSFEPIAAGQA